MPQYLTTDRYKMAECILVSIFLCCLRNVHRVRRSTNVNRYSSYRQGTKEEVT